jgi:hypothetical protein
MREHSALIATAQAVRNASICREPYGVFGNAKQAGFSISERGLMRQGYPAELMGGEGAGALPYV